MGESQRVREERTGWRDDSLSERHRMWGWDCPMIDVDFLAVEYDVSRPVALVEYKNEHARPVLATDQSRKVLARLGDMAGLPSFLARYASSFEWFRVGGINACAKDRLGAVQKTFSELEWVEFLYGLRGRSTPDNVAVKIEALHAQASQ